MVVMMANTPYLIESKRSLSPVLFFAYRLRQSRLCVFAALCEDKNGYRRSTIEHRKFQWNRPETKKAPCHSAKSIS
jgi:hypothetical protein